MNTDTFFITGTTHRVCQDYARSKSGDRPYAIVSDGCSSAVDSDFGCRLLTKAAEDVIQHETEEMRDWMLGAIAINAMAFGVNIQLVPESLCATLLMARVVEDFFEVTVVGDGVVAAKTADRLDIWEYEFRSGAPYYLRYEFDKKTNQDYFSMFKGDGTITHHNVSYPCHELIISYEQPFQLEPSEYIGGPIKRVKNFFQHRFPIQTTEFVAIMSDGVKSFTECEQTATTRQPKQVETVKVVKELLNFKGFNGEFVQRRCNRAFKDFKQKNWSNCDDVAIGVIVND